MNIDFIKSLLLALIALLLLQGCLQGQRTQPHGVHTAYESRQSDLQVEGEGVVVKVLKDDLKGSRHQRFILDVGRDLSVLVVHNIDLAPRIAELKRGDRVGFYGEYEYNTKGGVIHWTHHDPRKRHADGWLTHGGKRYQ